MPAPAGLARAVADAATRAAAAPGRSLARAAAAPELTPSPPASARRDLPVATPVATRRVPTAARAPRGVVRAVPIEDVLEFVSRDLARAPPAGDDRSRFSSREELDSRARGDARDSFYFDRFLRIAGDRADLLGFHELAGRGLADERDRFFSLDKLRDFSPP